MAIMENDDDDFLASPPEETLPSSRRSLKRLKKKADKKSEVTKSPRTADLISALDFRDTSFISTQELSPTVHLQSHSTPTKSRPTEISWSLYAKSGEDNSLPDSNFEMEPTNFSEGTPSDAEEDQIGLDPNEDENNDELDNSDAENSSSSESEGVDEDDEMAVLSLLGKARKSCSPSERASPTSSEKASPRAPSWQTPSVSLHSEVADTAIKNKKIKAAELEEMHAASQRLLRETPSASFKLQVSTGKSITSVLEKIRLRKMQLVRGWRSSVVHQPEDALEQLDQEVLSSKRTLPPAQNILEVEEVGTLEIEGQEIMQCNVTKDAEGDVVNTPERHAQKDVSSQVRTPEELAAGHKRDKMEKSTYLESGNAFRAPTEDTQDLLSPSQSSQEDIDVNLNLDTEEDNIFGGSRVNLHFDTETQDDYERWQDEEANKETMEPTPSDRVFKASTANGPSVRALIDDEAEDEDEDEDILVPGEEDEGDEGEDLQDMVIEETIEKERDQEKRAELHRKWLEQQDEVMTDDILLRLKTGWKPRESRKRGLDFLDDVELFVEKNRNIPDLEAEPQGFQESPDENSQDVETLRNETNEDEPRSFSFPEDLNDVHESDDEEAEQRMMRQRFLQESEEQGDLISPADDETSREIFVLINKVNIASSNKKLKQGSVSELRYSVGGTSNSNSSFTSKSSFLRRSVSSTVGLVQRQGSNSGSGARSFIFGRDDSNSSHSFDQHVDMREIKENIEPTSQGFRKETHHNKQFGQGKNSPNVSKPSSATRLGPSLFEVLRCQSTNLDQSLHKKSLDEGSPILAAFKPIKSTNTPRGARRA